MPMYNRENSHISKIIITNFFRDPTSHTQQKYLCSQNTISTKIFPYSYPQNFAINYTCQQIFHIHHDFVQPSLHNKFFKTSMPPKFKPKLIQQHHKLPTLPKFHKPPTLSRLHHDQKIQHFKNAPKPTLQYDQSYNAPNSNKITQQHNDNVSTSNFQFQISNSRLHVQIFTSQISNSKFSNSKFSNPNFQIAKF